MSKKTYEAPIFDIIDNPGGVINLTLQKLETSPLTINEFKTILPLMRLNLIEAGVNIDLSEGGLSSLREKQFRTLESGRGLGVVEALGGEKAKQLLEFCQSLGTTTIAGKEGTKGRGLLQLAADTILLLANESPSDKEIEDYLLRVHQRLKKDIERKSCQAPETAKQAYQSIPKLEDRKPDEHRWQKFASAPFDSLPKLWQFLTTPNK